MRPWLLGLLGALAAATGYLLAGGVGVGIALVLVIGAAYAIAFDRIAVVWQRFFERRR